MCRKLEVSMPFPPFSEEVREGVIGEVLSEILNSDITQLEVIELIDRLKEEFYLV